MKNKTKPVLLTALMILILHAGCINNQTKKETITIAGSTTVQPIAGKAAEEYMKKNKNIVVSVQGGGSGAGIKMVSEGSIDIGTSSREVTEEERRNAPDLNIYEIAADGIAIIVNPKNPIKDLSKQQIKDIFSGKIKNFKEVGGNDQPIVVIVREEGSGTRASFEEIVMDKGKTPVTSDAEQQPSNGAVKASVKNNPNAIGYVGAGYVDETVKAVSVDGVMPTVEDIKLNRYPVSRKLYMITKGEPRAVVKSFIDYMLSDEGQRIVEAEGFVRVR